MMMMMMILFGDPVWNGHFFLHFNTCQKRVIFSSEIKKAIKRKRFPVHFLLDIEIRFEFTT